MGTPHGARTLSVRVDDGLMRRWHALEAERQGQARAARAEREHNRTQRLSVNGPKRETFGEAASYDFVWQRQADGDVHYVKVPR